MPLPNTNVNELTSLTRDHFMGDVKDLVFNQNLFFKRLQKNQRFASGGARVVQPIMYQFDQDGAYFPYEVMDTSAQDQITQAQFNWKFYRQRIVVSEADLDMNSGPEEVYSLMESKTMGAGMAVRDSAGSDVFTAANGDTTRGFNSLENLLGDGTVPAGNTVCGGIDKATATNAFWRGINFDTSATLGEVADMLTTWWQLVDGGFKPNLILSHTTPLRVHQAQATGAGGFTAVSRAEHFVNESRLDSGFTTFTFQGMPWETDLHCPATRLFMLNMDFIHLYVHRKRNFELKPFVQPYNQDVNIAYIKLMAAITTSDPSRSGYMY